jgi:Mg2+-importing ATPase
MTTPDPNGTAAVSLHDAGRASGKLAPLQAHPKAPRTPNKTKNQNIRVSAAVLDAARRDGEALLRDLGTSLAGLSETEAEERARAAGPNEIAQERKQGWPTRILRIIRNPLVILLTILSAVSFLTGDARAGSVMALPLSRAQRAGRPYSARQPARRGIHG